MKKVLRAQKGFTLLEALIAVLVVTLALYALGSMHSMIIRGSGQAKARSDAIIVSQAKIEELRNIAIRTQFTGLISTCPTTVSIVRGNNTFNMCWSVTTPSGALEQRLVQVTTNWNDSTGAAQVLALNTLIGWDNVGLYAAGATLLANPSIAPLGAAKVGQGRYTTIPAGAVDNGDGSYKYRPGGGRIELIAADGTIVLFTEPKDGQEQDFTRISGRIYFDQNAPNNSLPSSEHVRVRLSSEGACIYENSPSLLIAATPGANSYKYFPYNCYVGAGWYGNVGVTVDDSVNGSAGDPTVCMGDPLFNSGVSNNMLTSAHSRESAVRSYRGFKAAGNSYLSTGVSAARSYPADGAPQPSEFPQYYASVTNNYFNHHFLVTSLSGNSSCASKMSGGEFTQNAGKYFCITPDNDPANDTCPSVWPGFESEVGNGGSINFSVNVSKQGNGSGLVVSSPSGINCGASCSGSFSSGSSVALTATPDTGSSFTGWSGGCSGTSTCIITLTANTNVTASFVGSSSTYPLAVTKAGTGSGTVTSSDSQINCGTTCSANYNSGASVTLTATPASGSVFGGWGGACTGTGACTVAMNSAQAVTATFTSGASSCNTQVSGSRIDKQGSIEIVAPAGAGSCTTDNSTKNFNCTLTVPDGTVVTLRNFRIQGTTYDITKTVTASCGSITNVNF
jgi:Tfp pilus assembly protein PilV